MTTDSWIPDDIVLDRPNVARIYDYLLGGFHNFEADRRAAEAFLEVYPDMRAAARCSRRYLGRLVTFLVEQGMDQFLDIGSGIPTVRNIHEVAQAINPAACVVYVDIDPVAVAHSKAMLKDSSNAAAIWGDAGQPDQILNHVEVRNLLDFSRPVAVLLIAVLHFVRDDEQAYGAVRTLRDALTSGSYIAIAQSTFDGCPPEVLEQLRTLYAGVQAGDRTRAQTLPFFDGLELVEPGLVYLPLWRPDGSDDYFFDHPERILAWTGVGRKP